MDRINEMGFSLLLAHIDYYSELIELYWSLYDSFREREILNVDLENNKVENLNIDLKIEALNYEHGKLSTELSKRIRENNRNRI